MAYDAVGIIMEMYGLEEADAWEMIRRAFKNGREVWTKQELEEYWIPEILEGALAERSDLNPELKDFNPEDDDIGLELPEGAEAAGAGAPGEEGGEALPDVGGELPEDLGPVDEEAGPIGPPV